MAFIIHAKPKKADPASFSPKYHLHRHLCQRQLKRPYTNVHASDLMGSRQDFCPREYALGLKYKNPRGDERIDTARQLTFDYGYAIEHLVRQYYRQMDIAHGNWQCEACGKLVEFQRCPSKCGCGSKAFEYKEITFRSQDSGVTCRPDLFLDFGRPKLTILEIKSIDKDEFKKLAAPLAEHRWRTSLYMRLVEESDSPFKDLIDTQSAYVLYVTKGGFGFKDPDIRTWKLLDGDFSPFKEFEVTRDDSQSDDLLGMATMVQTYKATGEVPLGICPTSLTQRAKWCAQADHCWSTAEMKG